MASAIATWDGNLPEAEVLEYPPAFREWFAEWMDDRRRHGPEDPEEQGWVLK
jgi:hypothetical protein